MKIKHRNNSMSNGTKKEVLELYYNINLIKYMQEKGICNNKDTDDMYSINYDRLWNSVQKHKFYTIYLAAQANEKNKVFEDLQMKYQLKKIEKVNAEKKVNSPAKKSNKMGVKRSGTSGSPKKTRFGRNKVENTNNLDDETINHEIDKSLNTKLIKNKSANNVLKVLT